jgi:hypothetical protein
MKEVREVTKILVEERVCVLLYSLFKNGRESIAWFARDTRINNAMNELCIFEFVCVRMCFQMKGRGCFEFVDPR